MKILVPIKRVIDYNIKVRVKKDNSDVDLSNTKMGVNPEGSPRIYFHVPPVHAASTMELYHLSAAFHCRIVNRIRQATALSPR